MIPDTAERKELEVRLQISLGTATMSAQGLGAKEGEPLTREVINAAKLMSLGLKRVKKDDTIEENWLGGEKLKFVLVPFGKLVEIVYPKDKLKKK